MSTEVNVKHLKINRLTEEQYATATKNNTELYLTPDTTDQDIADAISAHNTTNTAHSSLFSGKQDTLATQTAYSAKGSATKVPQITTNTLGQVTGITEVTITQPTVNNASLVIQKNSSNVATFTANASANVTCNITVPTKVSDLNNDSGFITGITANNVTTALGYTPYNSTNPNGYTSNTGTVRSVQVQAGTGLASSTSTAQNTTLSTTISVASGYKLPTTTEWSGKQDALPTQSGQSGKFLTTNGSTLSWATVSTGTSDYSSLTNKPSINSVTLSGNKTSSDLGLQPALATQTVYSAKGSATKVPQITTNNLGQVTSITEVTISQPTVNNATLSLQKNGTTVATFRANSASNVTCNITVPTTVAELSDSSNYIQTSELVELATVATSGSYNDLTDKPTIPQGTVTSVRVQAASPVVSSTSTAQSTSLNTTISLADGYGDTKNPYASKTKNYVLAAPSTANGVPTFRALTKADIPLASETAASGGTTTSLVTTGEKYTWNNKQNALTTQTAYSAKGSATKVPQITTNNLGQVTGITEVTITQPTVNNATLTIQKNGTTVSSFTSNASSNVTCNITVPTKTSELTNNSGFITGITANNVTTALGYTPYNSSNPSGYTTNTGTVTSVRVQAGTGLSSSTSTAQNTTLNTTISIASGYKLPTTTEWNNKQDALPSQSGQSGKFLTTNGSTMSWADASVEIDNSTITKNGSNQIQTVGYKDVRTNNTLKTWTGTRAQYDAIATKDANTLYNITDDTDTTAAMLELLYPVGAVYIGTMATCPLATLGIGSWEKIASDQVLQGSSVNHSAGDIIAAGLPNITGAIVVRSGYNTASASGAFFVSNSLSDADAETGSNRWRGTYSLDASRSSSIYGNSTTVQPPAFVVNIWRRIS